jgi:hypothetical protein
MSIAAQLKETLAAIQKECVAAGRAPDAVKLIAVSKTKPVTAVAEAAACGQVDFGENKVQEMVEKHADLPSLRWHLIGSLQRNKVKYIVPFVHLIHSVDSLRLLEEIERQAAKIDRQIQILLQVNISGEAQKGGFEPEEAEQALNSISEFPHVMVLGLMGMAEFTENELIIRRQFKLLSNLAQQYKSLEGPQIRMQELSMGMSGDYAIAIQEGATMVRIGSAIFGHR